MKLVATCYRRSTMAIRNSTSPPVPTSTRRYVYCIEGHLGEAERPEAASADSEGGGAQQRWLGSRAEANATGTASDRCLLAGIAGRRNGQVAGPSERYR